MQRLVVRRFLSRADAARRLGVSLDAKPEELKAAFLKQAKLHHPDSTNAEDGDRFKDINEAYELLLSEKDEPEVETTQDVKYKAYLEQEKQLRQKYTEWRNKQLEKGKKEEDLLTEEQYIAQARGVQAKMSSSLKRITLAAVLVAAVSFLR